MKTNWTKKVLNVPVIVRPIVYPAVFCVFIISGVKYILFEKIKDRYPLYINKNKLYLARTPVHHNTINRIDRDIQLKRITVNLKLRERIDILARFPLLLCKDIISICKIMNTISEIHIKRIFKKNAFIIILAYTYTYFRYESLLKLLLNSNPNKINHIACFEFGFIGAAVSECCQAYNIQSSFYQHGMLERGSEFIVKLNNYYIISPFDKFYLEFIFNEKLNCNFQFKKEWFISKNKKNKKERIALFALIYPTEILDKKFMVIKTEQIIKTLSKNDWKIILRPHPRDTSFWWEKLINKNNCIYLDPYSKSDIEESIKKNRALILVSFYSTSNLDAIKHNVLPVNLYHKPSELKLLFDFQKFTCVLPEEDYNKFSLMDYEDIEKIKKNKFQLFKKIY